MLQRALIGLLRSVASRRKPVSFQSSDITTILIVELTRLGDVLAMVPFLARLQTFFSHASIHIMVDQQYVSLLETFHPHFKFIGVKDPGSLFGVVQALACVREKAVDLVMSMSSPRRNVLAALSSNARFKMGYLTHVDSLTPFLLSTPVEAFGFKLSKRVSYSCENIYARAARLCEALGIDVVQLPFGAELKSKGYDLVRERLRIQRVIPGNKYVLLHPFSGWEYRNWNLADYIALGNRIIDEVGHDVVISCEKSDASRVRQMLSPGSPISVAASSDLLEVAALMKDASLVVCNDSGPLHLAAMLNVQSVGLFGPASPELTAPVSGCGTHLYKKVECSPCDQRMCVRPDRPCMSLHTINEVFAAVVRELGPQVVRESVDANG